CTERRLSRSSSSVVSNGGPSNAVLGVAGSSTSAVGPAVCTVWSSFSHSDIVHLAVLLIRHAEPMPGWSDVSFIDGTGPRPESNGLHAVGFLGARFGAR